MYGGDRDLDTICAVSTPPGHGGIAIIRVSGDSAYQATKQICRFLPETPISHKIYYGILTNLDHSEEIDEVLVSYFQKGKSFTGEETLEISCHGNPILQELILSNLIKTGCRIADRGEFTYRAFINDRIDLTQAEGVLSLIESQSKLSAKQALGQLKGNLSKELNILETELIWALAHLEASIDFSTEGIDVVDKDLLIKKLANLDAKISQMISTYDSGKIINEGLNIALVGKPNVGKSSLLNLILKEDKAIVTDIPGTTRDLVEGKLFVSGLNIKFLDTAGLRESDDLVEQLGIKKSYKAIEDANIIFYVFDSQDYEYSEDIQNLIKTNKDKLYLVFNKFDVIKDKVGFSEIVKKEFNLIENDRILFLSAKSTSDRDALIGSISNYIKSHKLEDQSLISNARHYNLLRKAHESLKRAIILLKEDNSTEIITMDLKDCLLYTQEIVGVHYDDQILDKIFKEFCLGK